MSKYKNAPDGWNRTGANKKTSFININDKGENVKSEKIITQTGSYHEIFFKELREFLYSFGAELRSAGQNDQHFAFDGKLYEIKLCCKGDDF